MLAHIVKPIIKITDKTRPLQDGQLELELEYNANNEIGDLASTIEQSMKLICANDCALLESCSALPDT